jgi:hypothetical protein
MDASSIQNAAVDYFMTEPIAIDSLAPAVPQIAFRLRDQKQRIIANWALRVATLPAFRAMPELPLEVVERHIPELLESALIAIATSDPTMDPAPLERAVELSRAHGRDRLLDDFTVGDVLSEFNALCREVWSALWRVIDRDNESTELLREFALRVGETFDAIRVAAAEAWAEAKMAKS